MCQECKTQYFELSLVERVRLLHIIYSYLLRKTEQDAIVTVSRLCRISTYSLLVSTQNVKFFFTDILYIRFLSQLDITYN